MMPPALLAQDGIMLETCQAADPTLLLFPLFRSTECPSNMTFAVQERKQRHHPRARWWRSSRDGVHDGVYVEPKGAGCSSVKVSSANPFSTSIRLVISQGRAWWG